jgi:hypothetical protein
VACRGGGGPAAIGRRPRQGSQPKEEEGRGKEGGEKRKEEKEKVKKRKGNTKKENKERKIEKGFRKLGEILGKFTREGKKDFCGFFWVSQIPALILGRR